MSATTPIPFVDADVHPGWYHLQPATNRAGQRVNMLFGPFDSPQDCARSAREQGAEGVVLHVASVYQPALIL